MKPSTLSLTYLKCLNYLTCLLRRWRRRSPMTSHPSDSTASVTYCFRIRCTLGPLCQDHVRRLPQRLFPLEGVIGDPGVCVNRGAAWTRRRAGRVAAAVGSAG